MVSAGAGLAGGVAGALSLSDLSDTNVSYANEIPLLSDSNAMPLIGLFP